MYVVVVAVDISLHVSSKVQKRDKASAHIMIVMRCPFP